VYEKSSLPQVFAKCVSVHGQWFLDNVMQLCNELVNPYSPFSSASIVPVCPPYALTSPSRLEHRQLYRWPWSSWRDHTRGLATSNTVLAYCSQITFGILRNVSLPVAYIVAPWVQLCSSPKECYLWCYKGVLGLLLMKWISMTLLLKFSISFDSRNFSGLKVFFQFKNI